MSSPVDDDISFCPSCGKPSRPGAHFCAFCGKQLRSSVSSVNEVGSSSDAVISAGVAEKEHKNSFFRWGKSRKVCLIFLWIFALAGLVQQVSDPWAGPGSMVAKSGAGWAMWCGILAATYAPERRFFWVLWFILGAIGSLVVAGLLSGLARRFI